MNNLVEIKVNTKQTNDVISNIAKAICIWDFRNFDLNGAFGKMPDKMYKEKYPFVEYVILMTFTGGKGYNEWFYQDENGKQITDFSVPLRVLKNVVRQGLKPIIVIGNVPYDLSDKSMLKDDDYGWGNRLPPKDYAAYFEYICAFAQMISINFSSNEYKNWIFRVGTEPDNLHWWTAGEEEYYKLYDYTVEALATVLGREFLTVLPGNLEKYDNWQNLLLHCANGKNYCTGKIGTQINSFSISNYQLSAGLDQYGEFPNIVETVKNRIKKFPSLPIATFNVGEGQYLSDGMSPSHRLSMAQDGSEYAASWMAELFDTCCKTGLDYYANWAYHCDFLQTDEPLLKIPAFHVASLIKKMSGNLSLSLNTDNSFHQGNKVGAIACYAQESTSFMIMAYNHNLARESFPEEIKLSLHHLKATDIANIKGFLIDQTHSNFFTKWLEDSKEIKRVESKADFDTLGSVFDTEVAAILNESDRKYWQSKKSGYAKADALQQISTTYCAKKNGDTEISFTLDGHAVAFFEISLLKAN